MLASDLILYSPAKSKSKFILASLASAIRFILANQIFHSPWRVGECLCCTLIFSMSALSFFFLFFLSFLPPCKSRLFLKQFMAALCMTSFGASLCGNLVRIVSIITCASFILKSTYLALLVSLSLFLPHQLTCPAHLLENKAHNTLLVASDAFLPPASALRVST